MSLPKLNLIDPCAFSTGKPVANNTCDGSSEPDEHAEPEEHAIPARSNDMRMDSPSILGTHRAVMDVMVRVLLECETIYTEEVDMIMKGASADEVKNELKERLNAKYEKKQAALKEGNV